MAPAQQLCVAFLCLIFGAATPSFAFTPPGTTIDNIAQVTYSMGGVTGTAASNQESFLVEALPPGPPATLVLTKAASSTIVVSGGLVQYRLTLTVSGNAAFGVTIDDRLPEGMRYRARSTLVNGVPAAEPRLSPDGRSLTFSLGDLLPGAWVDIRYVAELLPAATGGSKTNRAVAHAMGGGASLPAQATILVREHAFRTKATLIGSVIAGACEGVRNTGIAGARIYLEDGTSAVTDAQGRYHIEGLAAGLHVAQLDRASLPAGLEIAPCETNTRFAGRGSSQFVELGAGFLGRADFYVRPSKEAKTAPQPAPPPPSKGLTVSSPAFAKLEATSDEFAWLFPDADRAPAIPSTHIAIQHPLGTSVKLIKDGEEVSALNFDGADEDKAAGGTLSRWRGIALKEGDNHFEAVLSGSRQSGRLRRTIHYASAPVEATLVQQQSTLIADGKSAPVVALKFTDKDGAPARPGTTVEFTLDPPYLSAAAVEEIAEHELTAARPSLFLAWIEENGIARVALKPTVKAGDAILRVRLQHGEKALRVRLLPERRDWILVGLANSTVGHASLVRRMQAGGAADNDLLDDKRVAFFAKGTIKGEWLVTIAFDTARSRKRPDARLFRDIDPNADYLVYGDASTRGDEVESAGKLYVRVDRGQFSALAGDFQTGLTVTDLAHYQRRLSGLRSSYSGETIGYDAFVSDRSDGFVRDEIAGDGTSGLYRLSSGGVVFNSDSVTLETRDRFRAGVVVSTRALVRDIDYEIDDHAGTLFFKEPVPAFDASLNPIVIVARYEVPASARRSWTYGGRAYTRPFGDDLELGLSYVHEDAAATANDLVGADVALRLTDTLRLRAEVASTSGGGVVAGARTAYLAELRRDTGAFSGRLYVRDQPEGFGLGQLNAGLSGAREFGAELRQSFDALGLAFELNAQAYRRERRDSGARRDLGELIVTQRGPDYTLRGGFRHVEDRVATGEHGASDQIIVGASRDMLDGRLILRLDHEQSLPGSDTASDFPTRTRLGADYRLTPWLTLRGTQEFAYGPQEKSEASSLGFEILPWDGGRVLAGATQRDRLAAERIFATLGLSQNWRIDDAWSASIALDRRQTMSGAAGAVGLPSFGDSGGGEDFNALSVGLGYEVDGLSTTLRLEGRDGASEDKVTLALNLLAKPQEAMTFNGRLRALQVERAAADTIRFVELRLGVAYRPDDSAWAFLSRFDLSLGAAFPALNAPDALAANNDHVAAVWQNAINYRACNLFDASLQYGAEYVSDRIGGKTYGQFSQILGAEFLYYIAPRFDAGFRASLLHRWDGQQVDYAFGPAIGFNVVDNTYVSAGYNVGGFVSNAFDALNYTDQGPYVQLRVKFDETSADELLAFALGR